MQITSMPPLQPFNAEERFLDISLVVVSRDRCQRTPYEMSAPSDKTFAVFHVMLVNQMVAANPLGPVTPCHQFFSHWATVTMSLASFTDASLSSLAIKISLSGL